MNLELRLDSINLYGGAVFGTTESEPRWYVMNNVDDQMHEFNPRIDRFLTQTGE